MRLVPLVLVLLTACEPAKVDVLPDPTDTNVTDTDTDADSDSDADTDTDADTDADLPVNLTDLSWRLHEEIDAMVYASWSQDAPANVHVEYSFDDGVWASTPSFDALPGPQEQLVVGIPYATDAAWRVVADSSDTADGPTITTGDFPSGLRQGELLVWDEAATRPGYNYLMTTINQTSGGWTGGNYWTFIMDRQARVVWAHLAPDRHWSLYATVAVTRDHILWDESTYWSDYDDGAASKIHRRYLDEEIEVLDTPGLHHEFVQLPDGTLVWGSQDVGGGEALVEMAPGATERTIIWTCNDDWPGSGRCESNGLFYDEATNTYLYSFYTNNSIVEVDRATGHSNWWAGDVRDGYTFDPPESQYSWQHGVSWTDTGTLLVSSTTGRDDTLLLEYEVDRTNGVLHNVWENSSEVYASTNGDAWRYENGNTLHMVGAAGVAREVGPDGVDVWRVDFNNDYLLGRGELIQDLYTLVKPRE